MPKESGFPLDVYDTTSCPIPTACEVCDSDRCLEIVTAQTAVGIFCAAVCRCCLDVGRLPDIAGWREACERVLAHCEHLGADLDEVAAAMQAEEESL